MAGCWIVCSRPDALSCLSIVDGYLQTPSRYPAFLNPERFYKRRLGDLKLLPRLQRFPRIMFTAAGPGDTSRWLQPTTQVDPIFGVRLKYEEEYVLAKWRCGYCESGQSHSEAYCCWNVGRWWARSLEGLLGGRMQVWDTQGSCSSQPSWLLRLIPLTTTIVCVALGIRRGLRGITGRGS